MAGAWWRALWSKAFRLGRRVEFLTCPISARRKPLGRYIGAMITDAIAHSALEARDARFDGCFFTGVTSTGVYCRCVCPARLPKPANRRFFPSSAAAEKAGFRPCLLCRPERAPGHAPIDRRHRLASEALRLIEAGMLEERGMAGLSAVLGITDRHLRRATLAAFGASPIELAQTHRLLTAKRLLRETQLPITDIAFAAGFGSLRRFNALFLQRYRLAPSKVRQRAPRSTHPAVLTLELQARGAFDAAPWLSFAAARALPGMEHCADGRYERLWRVGGQIGRMAISAQAHGVRLELEDSLAPAIRPIVAAVRGALDLDCDMQVIDAVLDGAVFLPRGRGLRIAGGLDPLETAVRAVLGQQVTLAFGRRLAHLLLERFGDGQEREGPNRLFPTPAQLASADPQDIARLGMPLKRAETVQKLAAALAEGRLILARGGVQAGRDALARVPGIGPWTVEYVALRALSDPDAFPAGDSALAAALGIKGQAETQAKMASLSPWRGYGAMRLWHQHAQEKLMRSPMQKGQPC